jgi:hypothetical protein
MSEAEVIDVLGRLSVEDCVAATSRLACQVDVASIGNARAQLNIIDRMGFTPEFRDHLRELASGTGLDVPRTLFFSQQVNHLMRLTLLHCADRPGDQFNANKDADLFAKEELG